MQIKKIYRKYGGLYTGPQLNAFVKEKGAQEIANCIYYFNSFKIYLTYSYYNEDTSMEVTLFGNKKEGIRGVEKLIHQAERDVKTK